MREGNQQLNRLRPGQTIDTTALVHEAYLNMVDQTRVQVSDRNHFYAISARAMRQILVDYARRKSAAKRGSGIPPIPLTKVQVGEDRQADLILALDQALEKLGELDGRLAQVFDCRYFAGLTPQETADALDISLRTAQRDWSKSKAWLRRELSAESI
ncbi:MAG: sigma-70 family RNA polymerase sigma factor [Nitrospirae bacterium]|nr:sigma-70 family RNA polymerase sigma factor [Nitrospirota bacterium]